MTAPFSDKKTIVRMLLNTEGAQKMYRKASKVAGFKGCIDGLGFITFLKHQASHWKVTLSKVYMKYAGLIPLFWCEIFEHECTPCQESALCKNLEALAPLSCNKTTIYRPHGFACALRTQKGAPCREASWSNSALHSCLASCKTRSEVPQLQSCQSGSRIEILRIFVFLKQGGNLGSS